MALGDVFVSALCGELMNGQGMPQALKDAAEFCDDCVAENGKTRSRATGTASPLKTN